MIRYRRRRDTNGILPQLHRPPKPQVIITMTTSGAVQADHRACFRPPTADGRLRMGGTLMLSTRSDMCTRPSGSPTELRPGDVDLQRLTPYVRRLGSLVLPRLDGVQ